MNQSELLNVNNLSIGFKQYVSTFKQDIVKPIKNINLKVHRGEIVAIIGASGSGKSLLAHSIMGILPNNSIVDGDIYFKETKLTQELKEKFRKNKIVLIPQSINYLDPLMKVGKQVRNIVYHGNPILEQRKAFERYHLKSEVENLYPFQISGGMARRVLISTALVRQPELIIADEPTPGLNSELVTETLNHLKEFANTGCGILMITHDIDSAMRIADKIVVFYDGQTIDTIDKKYFHDTGDKLTNKYTKKLWSCLPQNRFIDANYEITVKSDESLTLVAENISFSYGKKNKILSNVNFKINSGEIVGIKGPSGQGKTTFAKILAGYIKPDSGLVKLGGKSIETKTYNPVQLIYQHPEKAVNPRWRLNKTLTESFPINQGVLDELNIKNEWIERYPHELSGGELQRLCIARVLHKDTKFLIADEMTSMLDAITQAKVWEFILKYVEKYNMGLIIISHENTLLSRLCTRIIDMSNMNV